jgi:hypothetical protein
MPPRARKPEYGGRHRAEVTRIGASIPPVFPDAPGKPGTKGPTATKRRGPQHERKEAKAEPVKATPRKATPKPTSSAPARPVSARPSPPNPPAAPERRRPSQARVERLAAEGHEYAQRQAIRATTARPSVTGRVASGAAAGGATGAVIGGPVGAGVGAVLGGTAGGVSGSAAKRAYKAATRAAPHTRKIIVAEFAVCIVIAALSPLTDKRKDEPAGAFMRRMTAIMGLFFILALMSVGGRGMARFAAGLGGLVTVALAVSERNLFNVITARLGADRKRGPVEAAESVGGTIGEVAAEVAGTL